MRNFRKCAKFLLIKNKNHAQLIITASDKPIKKAQRTRYMGRVGSKCAIDLCCFVYVPAWCSGLLYVSVLLLVIDLAFYNRFSFWSRCAIYN